MKSDKKIIFSNTRIAIALISQISLKDTFKLYARPHKYSAKFRYPRTYARKDETAAHKTNISKQYTDATHCQTIIVYRPAYLPVN